MLRRLRARRQKIGHLTFPSLRQRTMSDTEAPTGDVEAGPSAPAPLKPVYCAICTFPPEYCEFSSSSTKCRAWLSSSHPELAAKIYSDEALTQKLASLTTKQADDLEKEAAKKEKRAEAKAEKDAKALKSQRITLTKMARTKKKATTAVFGLHLFSPPLPALKVISKGFVLPRFLSHALCHVLTLE